jgi:hypothetical protein
MHRSLRSLSRPPLNAGNVGQTGVTVSDEIKAALEEAIEAQDADAFEDAVSAAWRADLPRELSGVLGAALLMPWHTRHEDLASALQRLKDPRTIDVLFKAATSRHAYLEYDEFFGLARKCTWALADIGTPEAKEQLQQLARGQNQVIAAYAQKRLDHWERERHRKIGGA